MKVLRGSVRLIALLFPCLPGLFAWGAASCAEAAALSQKQHFPRIALAEPN